MKTGSGSVRHDAINSPGSPCAIEHVEPQTHHQVDAVLPPIVKPAISGVGSINIAGGVLKIGNLGESLRINFVSGGGGRLYVQTTDKTVTAIERMIGTGRILVDGRVQTDSLRLEIIEHSDGPDLGSTEIRLR
ncbi:MAG: hypothetical protein WCN95_05385 [bacterium]